MARYLIDVNLPYRFSLWNGPDYIHQNDIDQEATDSAIWAFAAANKLTIVTKDADFSNRILFHRPPSRVIHIRFGNLKMREFFTILSGTWDVVTGLSESHKLVNVFRDRIEAIE